MKRGLVWTLGIAAVALVGGFLAFQHYKIYLPGVIGRLKDPIQPNQAVTWASGPAPAATTGRRPPNIILIVADDLGINDLTSTGTGVGGVVATPAIDSIARDGVSFVNGYAGNATCSPSRAAMMTGRYPTRFGFEFTAVPTAFARNIARVGGHGNSPIKPIFYEDRVKDMPDVADMGVPAGEQTIAELLKTAGYRTMHIGKWHLGEAEGMRPENQGFDESLGFYAGAAMFLPPRSPDVVNSKQPWDPIDQFLWANLPYSVRFNGSRPFAPKGYMTDYFGDEAVKAIRANKDRPFFLYLAFNAPHTPLQAARADYDALSAIKDPRLRVYGGMVRALDRNVGKVLAAVKDLGLEGDTIVIFTSDNGGANYIGLPDINKPYRGFKATFFEGGVRVPYFVRWPGVIQPGATAQARAMHFDVFATAARASGAGMPAAGVLDGVDLVALAKGEAPDRPLFFRSGHYRVVIWKQWKLQLSERPKKAWLFDLAADPQERNNLAAANPAVVAELTRMLDAQDARAARPIWPALIEGPIWIDRPTDGKPAPRDAEYVMWAN